MRKLRLIVLSAVLLLSVFLGMAQEKKASLSFDKDEIKLGDQIIATLELTFPVTELYDFAKLKDTLTGKIEIVEFGKIDTTYAGNNLSMKMLSAKLILTSFDTGYHAIPPIYFAGQTDSLKTEAQLIHVSDVEVELPDQASQGESEIEIKDIKDIHDVSFSLWEWFKMNLLYLVFALLLVAGIWAYFKFIHPKLKDKGVSAIVPKKIIPPYVIAVDKLKKLDQQKLWQSGKIKTYHSELSEIIREYLENQFSIPALESTTVEIEEAIKQENFSEHVKKELTELLQLSDLVKFAKYIPLGDENDACIKMAYKFVDATRPDEVSEDSTLENTENV